MIIRQYPTNAEIIALRKKRKKKKLGHRGTPNYVPSGATTGLGESGGGHQGGG